MLSDDELRQIFNEVSAGVRLHHKGFRAIVAAGLRRAADHADVSAEHLQSIADEYDALNSKPPLSYEEWYAQRAKEDAAAAAASPVREMVVEGRVVQIDDTSTAAPTRTLHLKETP